jgi:hypothetical protein
MKKIMLELDLKMDEVEDKYMKHVMITKEAVGVQGARQNNYLL